MSRRIGGGAIVVLMAIGSAVMWIGVPAAWLWLGSQLTDTRQPDASLYIIVGCGIVISMAAMGLALGRLNRLYVEITHTELAVRSRRAWDRPQSGPQEGRLPTNVLEAIMVVTVGIALIAFFVWFFVFAGSPLA